MIILGIESSCDDTSVCLIRQSEVLSHMSFSQETILKEWGGIVPEIAARNHLTKLTPLLKQCFDQAKLGPEDIDLIGVTTHPGLLGPLLTGLNAAKTLSLIHHKPIYPVNHLFAHLEAIHLTESIPYPYLGLLVSGGHSVFFLVKGADDFSMIGSTTDDAAGEAFDKGGKILGLGYPAGKTIDELAKKGDEKAYKFPIGLKASKTPQMSFSGVKTSLRVFVDKNPDIIRDKQSQEFFDLCASYQYAIVESLRMKLEEAKKLVPPNTPVVVGGGVACNTRLRSIITNAYFVKPEYCTDNGAMIANIAALNSNKAIPYPECLALDARGRYIKKGKHGEIAIAK